MYRLLIKISRLSFLGFLTLLLISSIGKDIHLKTPLKQGTHNLRIVGEHAQNLNGQIRFEIVAPYLEKELKQNVLKLSFVGEGDDGLYRMELLVSKINDTNKVFEGNYRVTEVDSFLRPFDGVFGALSNPELGSRPFFASDGIVRITQCDETRTLGVLDLEFTDYSGNIYAIKGDFNAI